MTYNVFGETLNLAQSINLTFASANDLSFVWQFCCYIVVYSLVLCSICCVMNYYTLPTVHSTRDTILIRTESKHDLDM